MRDNILLKVPQVKPGSDEGFIVARTRLNTELLSDADETTF